MGLDPGLKAWANAQRQGFIPSFWVIGGGLKLTEKTDKELTFMETYLLVIGKTATGYSANCPDVLGCAAVGKMIEEVVANMKKALKLHFEGLVEAGDLIPKAGGDASYRTVIQDLDVDQYFPAHVQIDTSRFAAPATQP